MNVLMYVSRSGNVGIVQLLLDHKFRNRGTLDIDAVDRRGNNALLYAQIYTLSIVNAEINNKKRKKSSKNPSDDRQDLKRKRKEDGDDDQQESKE